MTYDDVMQKVVSDLAWRGPGGKSLRYVVLEREQAELLLKPEYADHRVIKQQLLEALTKIGILEQGKRG